MTANGLPPGTLLGAFEVESTLGRGGMGAVYRARNRITGDARALKVILPELAARPEFVSRFVREIRLAMAVEHPNLVRVFEPGMHGEQIFLPMELLEGESLALYLRRERVLSVTAMNDLLQAVGSAIAALHAKGILHRDVKPSNVFMSQENGTIIPKLLDLGAGKDVDTVDEATSTGLAIGSPHYMAPEQAAGRKDIDARVDQYALGTLAYQLLTGARPYENDDTGHVLAKVLSGAPYKLPRELQKTIPPNVEAVIVRAMSRAREDRYATVWVFLNALNDATANPSPSPGAPAMDIGDSTRAAPLAAPVPGVFQPIDFSASAFAPKGGPTGVEPSGTMRAGVVSKSTVFRPGTRWVAIVSGVATFTICLGVVWLRSGDDTAAPPPASAAANSTSAPASTTPPATTAAAATPPPTATTEPSPPATATVTASPPPPPPPQPTRPSVATAAPSPATPPMPPATTTARNSHRNKPPTPAPDSTEPCHATPGSPCL